MSQGFTSQLPVPLPVAQGGTGVTTNNWTAGSLTFSPTTQGIVGTTTNDNAAAGYVGEYISSTVTASAITNNTFTNVTSISLTAGDWDVFGSILTNPAATTTQSGVSCGINTVSATFPSLYTSNGAYTAGNNAGLVAPTVRLSLNTTTTVYLVAAVVYSISTLTITGFIGARRRR
jgi:hypothetical protein